jgi:hypothetical protein
MATTNKPLSAVFFANQLRKALDKGLDYYDAADYALEHLWRLIDKYNSLVTLCHEWQPKCGGCEEFKEKLNEYEGIE